MKKISTAGINALFIYRGWGQNSLQATVDRPPGGERPLIIPRTGTSAPTGTPTLQRAENMRKK